MHSRRSFLKAGSAAVAAAAAPRPLLAQFGRIREPLPSIQDSRVKELAQRALDAARTAGASYADIRLIHTRVRWITENATDLEWMTVGVRALTKGYWGFAASPIWSPDEMVHLARQAVQQAAVGSLGQTRSIKLTPLPQVADGHWEMPVAIDPFTIPVGEIVDYKASIESYAGKRALARGYGFRTQNPQCLMATQEKAFGSTDGSYCTQRLFRTSGTYDWTLQEPGGWITRGVPVGMDYLPWSGLGWELYRGQPLRDYTDRLIEEAIEDLTLPRKPVDIGRYETVWDAASVAELASATIGLATEADRVFGYEANATGTSYLNAPLDMLGQYTMGSPLLTITGNRTEPGGVATVKWDDDGVVPHEFTLVKNGVLTDLSTTRESAGWLADHYTKSGMPVRSHGCALGAQDVLGRGMNIPVACTPNLTMAPGTAALDFDACVAGVTKGLAFRRMQLDMDFQQGSGLGSTAMAYEIRNGKRVAVLEGAGLLFRATDLWKSLIAIGGNASQRRFAVMTIKGEPPQWAFHSIHAVPAVFKDVGIIDIARKS